MTADRLFDLLALLVLACVGISGLARTVALAVRGIWVVPIDRERRPIEALIDLTFLLGLLAWIYQVIAMSVAPDWRVGAGSRWELEVQWPLLRSVGLVVAVAGVAIYVKALSDLGLSWRFTIDRQEPGELVTTGVFALTRNPIYLALALVVFGVSLTLGSITLAFLSCAGPVYLQNVIAREERFLAAYYGEAYESYRRGVPRWLRWSRSTRDPRDS